MRYPAIAAALVALAAACGGDATQPSTPGAGDLAQMTLQDEDVPPGIAVLSEIQVIPSSGKGCLSPEESPAAFESTLVVRTFDAPEPFPARGAQRVIVTSTIHSSIERAHGELVCTAWETSSYDIDRLLQPGWDMISYEEMERLEVGEVGKAIHYVVVNAEGLVFVETYWANFRRDNVTAVLNVRAPLDNVSEEQFEALATKLDQRVREGLLSLQ